MMKFVTAKAVALTITAASILSINCYADKRKTSVKKRLMKPVAVGEWNHIFDPNVKHTEPKGAWYTNDHTFVQTKDGRWHAYGIIGKRPANPWKGETNLFHASADKLTGPWREHDYALTANQVYERVLWAPYVFKEKATMYMFYNVGNMQRNASSYASWGGLCMATSDEADGYSWKRHDLNPIFSDAGHARDSYILKDNGKYYFYYTKTVSEVDLRSAVAIRTSPDLKHWSGPKVVNIQPKGGHWGGNAESPFVVKRDGIYYLFVCVAMVGYEKTNVYWSEDPENFPEENLLTVIDAHAPEIIQDNGKWYISNTGWGKHGLYLKELKWEKTQ